MSSHFFASISRMKYINRWALMRSSQNENLAEHSLETAIIAHALCVIGNVRYEKKLDAEKAALIGMYHDASEIITGDMPTPVKYSNKIIKDAYKDIEKRAEQQLLGMLPNDLQSEYSYIFNSSNDENDEYIRKLVKAADRISAYIKCIEEEKTGNKEFTNAKESIIKSINEMNLCEVRDFMAEFIPSYGMTLDELLEFHR